MTGLIGVVAIVAVVASVIELELVGGFWASDIVSFALVALTAIGETIILTFALLIAAVDAAFCLAESVKVFVLLLRETGVVVLVVLVALMIVVDIGGDDAEIVGGEVEVWGTAVVFEFSVLS